MKYYKKIFSSLSATRAMDVYMCIYLHGKKEEYPMFEEIAKELKMNKNTLRKLTNLLSRNKMIYSAQPNKEADKRKRVYLVEDNRLAELLLQIWTL